MPKRPPTPPTIPTGKYLTVHQPYPPEPNMELVGHRKEVAFWISNCLGNDEDLIAMYYKPKSDKIILEIKDTFSEWRVILGEHRWEEILKTPTKDEKGQCSQIFYCRFTHDREVQKHGWKRIDVLQSWFRDWSLHNGKIVHPYPLSHFCEVPPETPTSAPLCRPLPVEYWPRLLPKVEEKATAPVPGSIEWQQTKRTKAATNRGTSQNAWQTASTSVKTAKIAKHASNIPPSVPKPPNARNRQHSAGSPPAVHLSSSTTPFPARPTTDAYPGSASNASGQSYGTAWTSYPGLSRTNTSSNSKDSSDSDSVRATPHTPKSAVPLDQAMSGVSIQEPSAELWMGGDDDGEVWDEDIVLPNAAGVSTHVSIQPTEVQESLWDDYEEEEELKKDPDAIICEEHGALCKKGICSQYKKQKRAMERAKEAEARKKQKKKTPLKSDGSWRNGGSSDKVKYPGEPGVQRTKPAHLLNPQSLATTASTWQATPTPTIPSENTDNTNGTARQKPAHLASSTTASPAEPSVSRPARGRRMNTQTANAGDDKINDTATTSAVPSTGDDWGYVPRDIFGGSVGAPSVRGKANGGNDDAKSVAASSTGGWGHPPPGPWDSAPSAVGSRSSKGKGKGKETAWKTPGKGNEKSQKGKSWADQMDEADASPGGGWGAPSSNDPWS